MDAPWQLEHPVDAVSFDCDGTLSEIEGIDQLALENHVKEPVEQLTHEAMSTTGLNADLYAQRLGLVQPSNKQTEDLANTYFSHLSPDTQTVINVLHALNKAVYVISAGNNPAVTLFAQKLKINKQNTFAVDLFFDEDGNYNHFDHQSPMVNAFGKNKVLKEIQKKHPRVIHIGDGINDIETQDHVTRFIGYGGHFFRQSIADQCSIYIKSKSLLPVLPLTLTQAEMVSLNTEHQETVRRATGMLNDHVLMS